jgi:hypothetical protein
MTHRHALRSRPSAASLQQLNASTTQHHLAVAHHKRTRTWNPKRHAAEQSSDCSVTHAHTRSHTHTHTFGTVGQQALTKQIAAMFQNGTLQYCLRTTDNPSAEHSLHRSISMQGTKEANDKPPIPSPPAQPWPTPRQAQPPRSSSSSWQCVRAHNHLRHQQCTGACGCCAMACWGNIPHGLSSRGSTSSGRTPSGSPIATDTAAPGPQPAVPSSL